MKKLMILVTSLLMTALCSVSFAQSNPKVLIDTSMGQIEAELYPKKAPVTVQNFLAYVNNKFYDGLVFHRVIDGFMIQGGGMNAELKEKATLNPIKIESNNGLKNTKGTLAMARTSDPNSATSQFFINVFGKVTKGMDVVEKIGKVKTGSKGFHEDVPLTPVTIKSIRVIK